MLPHPSGMERQHSAIDAILAHAGRKAAEAREVTRRFNGLPSIRQQDPLDFLRSL